MICSRGDVTDAAARRFAKEFYLSLGKGDSVRVAFDFARESLRIDSDTMFQEQAELFALRSQPGADRATLLSLRGAEGVRGCGPTLLPGVKLEEAKECVDRGPGVSVEHFRGRTKEMLEMHGLFVNPRISTRVIVLHGPKGIGKSALGVTLASFASSPGRFFSSSPRVVTICDGDESPNSIFKNIGGEVIAKSIEGEILLVLVDRVGAISGSPELQRKLGDLLDSTRDLRLIICSQDPIYSSLGDSKVRNCRLAGLAGPDAARLFMDRVHRQILRDDFPADVLRKWSEVVHPEPLERRWREMMPRLLADHPLLKSLEGHPARIRAMASRVFPGGPSLLELSAAP